MEECLECGAMVQSMGKHRRWHKALSDRVNEIEGTADDALQKAEYSENVLFQRGLD